jgi:hypothetical protein
MTPAPTSAAFHAEMRDNLFRIAHRLLRYHEDRLDPLRVLDNPVGRALLREASGHMALWTVCEKSACRRAGKCRRPPGSCVTRHAPLLPTEAQRSAIATLKSRDPLDFVPRAWAARARRPI